MRFDYILIGILLVALFTVGGVMMIEDMAANYESVNMTSDDFMNVTDTVSEMFNLTVDSKEKVLDQEISSGDESWESMTKGSYSAIRFIQGTFKIIHTMIYSVSEKLHVPPVFIVILYTIFTVSAIASIIYMIFRFLPK